MRWSRTRVALWLAVVASMLAVSASSATAPAIRCSPPPARGSPNAAVGAYYFDGWAGPADDGHFDGLSRASGGRFAAREPLYGWGDRTVATMRAQLGWAHAFGIGFFVFDWYSLAVDRRDPTLDDALTNYTALRSHDGVGFALDYVNTDSAPDDFVVPPADWAATIAGWLREFARPGYTRVDGEPLLIIYDAPGLTRQLGGAERVAALLSYLRLAAHGHGLPGVFVVGGLGNQTAPPASTLAALAGEGFDAITQYAYPAVAGAAAATHSYGGLITAETGVWGQLASEGGPTLVPAVMAGWDPRPWHERTDGVVIWFNRTAPQFQAFVRDALAYAREHPPGGAPPAPRPLILITAWNELGEGSYIVPTVGSCDGYGEALAGAVGTSSLPGG